MQVKMHPCLNYFYQFLVCFSQFFVGIHLAWTSVYIPQFLKGSPFQITSEEGSWITTSFSIGAAIGSLLPPIADKIGRKATILVTTTLFFTGSLVLVFANSVWVFCLARTITGAAMGLLQAAAPLYLGEISFARTRGAGNTIMYVLNLLGLLYINLAGVYLSNKATSVVLVVLSFIASISCICLPESPYYLAMLKKDDDGKTALQRLQGVEDIDRRYEIIKTAVEEQRKNKAEFIDLVRVKTNRKALLVLFLVSTGRMLAGDGIVDAYAQTIFSVICPEIAPESVSLIYYTSALIFTSILIYFIDKVGRRRLLLTSLILMALLSLLFGVYISVKVRTSLNFPTLIEKSPIVFLICYSVFDSFLCVLCEVTLSEIFPMNVKMFAALLLGIYMSVMCFSTLKFFQVTADYVGMDVPFFAFVTCGFIFFVLIYVFMFECVGKTLEQIQEEMRKL